MQPHCFFTLHPALFIYIYTHTCTYTYMYIDIRPSICPEHSHLCSDPFFLPFPSLPPPSFFPSHPFFPVTKLAVSLSICWFFLQRPCTCSHLLSCWPPLLSSPLSLPPLYLSLFLFLSPSLPLSPLGAMLPGPFLAQLASLSFNPSVGKSTLFTAGGPSLFSSSRNTKAPPPTPRSVVSKSCPKSRKLQLLKVAQKKKKKKFIYPLASQTVTHICKSMHKKKCAISLI